MFFWLIASLCSADPTRPHTVWAQLHEAQLLETYEQEFDEAIDIYEALLEGLTSKDFSYGELWYWKGIAHMHQKDFEEAAACFEQSTQSALHYDRGQKAIKELSMIKNRVLELPYSGNPWVNLGSGMSDWSLVLDPEASSLDSFNLRIKTKEPVVSIQIQIEGWSGEVWGHSINLIEGEGVVSLRLQQLRPTPPENIQIRAVKLICKTPSGQAANIEILESTFE